MLKKISPTHSSNLLLNMKENYNVNIRCQIYHQNGRFEKKKLSYKCNTIKTYGHTLNVPIIRFEKYIEYGLVRLLGGARNSFLIISKRGQISP